MKWAISFPEEEILIVRPSLGSICAGVKPAAKLLSVLLYRYSIRKESKEDADNINELRSSKGETPTQDTTFRIYRKQEQLVKDMCGEITEKTLHDVAVPTLQLLGYLDIDESSPVHCYDLHPDMVIAAMEAYKKGEKQLEKVLNANLQLEKFLIDPQLEKVLINKKNFQLALEKVLIANRKSSNNKRGRKPASEKGLDTKNQKPQSNIDYLEINKEEHNVIDDTANADVSTTSQNPLSEKHEEETTTPPTTSQDQQTEKPTSQRNAPRRSAGSGKSKRTKKDQARELLQASEIAAPQKPDPATHPYNGELFMKLADYYRGTTLPESTQPTSQYMQAVSAAASLVQRKAKFEDVDKVFRFLLGLDRVKDEKWLAKGYNTDLWIVARHLNNKLLEYRNMERQSSGASSARTQTADSATGMSHDQALQLANTVVAQGKEHGLTIQARATSTSSNAWVVNASWNGNRLPSIASQAFWDKYLVELKLIAEDDAAEQKGVN